MQVEVHLRDQAVLLVNPIGLHAWVPDWKVGSGSEVQIQELPRQREHAIAHARIREIGAQCRAARRPIHIFVLIDDVPGADRPSIGSTRVRAKAGESCPDGATQRGFRDTPDLVQERAALALEVQRRRSPHVHGHDVRRERELLERAANGTPGPMTPVELTVVFDAVLRASRSVQRRHAQSLVHDEDTAAENAW